MGETFSVQSAPKLHKSRMCVMGEFGSWKPFSATVRQPVRRWKREYLFSTIYGVWDRYRTTSENRRIRRLSAYCSELSSVRVCDSATITCSYDSQELNKSNYQSEPRTVTHNVYVTRKECGGLEGAVLDGIPALVNSLTYDECRLR